MKNHTRLKERKAISTIIGGFFFLILMLGTFTALFTALQLQTDTVSTQRMVTDQEAKKFQEKFSVGASLGASQSTGTDFFGSACSSGSLCFPLSVKVFNAGSDPVELVNLWVSEKKIGSTNCDPNCRAKEFELVNTFVPISKVQTTMLSGQTILLKKGTYDIKVVSANGNMQTAHVSSEAVISDLAVRLFTVPPNVRPGGNVTLAMHVFNRGVTTLLDVTPATPVVDPFAVKAVAQKYPNFVERLLPGEDFLFTWDYQLIGAVNTEAIFTNTATAIDAVTAATVTSNQGKAKALFVQPPKSFIQQPEISLIVPSPFGETTSDKGLWGVSVSNPTDVAITVTRVLISITVPNTAQQESIIDKNSCAKTPITPTTASEWSCPQNNVIEWKDTANPESVPARGIRSFLAKFQTGNMGGTDDDPAYIISASVFSSFGAFSKGPVVSGMLNGGDGGIGNVYLTNDPNDPLNDAKILANMTNIASGKIGIKFNVTLAELSTGTGNDEKIASGAKLIINVPSGFRNVAITGSLKFTTPIPTPVEFSDASTQITGTTSEIIGDLAGGKEAAYIRFTADSPTVTINSLYPLFIYAEGSTSTGFPVGTFAEIPLQVCKTGGC